MRARLQVLVCAVEAVCRRPNSSRQGTAIQSREVILGGSRVHRTGMFGMSQPARKYSARRNETSKLALWAATAAPARRWFSCATRICEKTGALATSSAVMPWMWVAPTGPSGSTRVAHSSSTRPKDRSSQRRSPRFGPRRRPGRWSRRRSRRSAAALDERWAPATTVGMVSAALPDLETYIGTPCPALDRPDVHPLALGEASPVEPEKPQMGWPAPRLGPHNLGARRNHPTPSVQCRPPSTPLASLMILGACTACSSHQ